MSASDRHEREAARFHALISLVTSTVPEVHDWWLDSLYGDEFDHPLTLGDAQMLAGRHLFHDDVPIDSDAWPRLLQVVEVAFGVSALLDAQSQDDDVATVDAFAEAGIVCHITRTIAGLELLLPWMGPMSVDAARREVFGHAASRGFDEDAVDWSKGGSNYAPLDVVPSSVAPVD